MKCKEIALSLTEWCWRKYQNNTQSSQNFSSRHCDNSIKTCETFQWKQICCLQIRILLINLHTLISQNRRNCNITWYDPASFLISFKNQKCIPTPKFINKVNIFPGILKGTNMWASSLMSTKHIYERTFINAESVWNICKVIVNLKHLLNHG